MLFFGSRFLLSFGPTQKTFAGLFLLVLFSWVFLSTASPGGDDGDDGGVLT